MPKKLTIVLGPTAVGKTDYAISLACSLGTEIVNCDSRQIFKEMNIGVARPSAEELARVKHHFIACRPVSEPYTAGQFELDALALLDELFKKYDTVVMAGGSGFYIDALCNGLDDFPAADPELREELTRRAREEGVESLRMDLKRLDPASYEAIDIANWQRVVRALEVTIATGRKFSDFKTATTKSRPFEIEKIGLRRDRDILYERINHRVDQMMEQGLLEEARSLLPMRDLPALNTVGYKELFSYFDGSCSLDEAVYAIKRNTRHYAKRQLTYWGRDNSIRWIDL
ncbi:MAG: tRNA (adenosine(37)-N6)-dimethylallyltransferase MiaA [Bacteroidales bacterium]|nr:tRNA (adenosine(37)-N6)-dimethylallyltransferase MiaA [Bacteroidales bacterium]